LVFCCEKVDKEEEKKKRYRKNKVRYLCRENTGKISKKMRKGKHYD